ncbi:MAG: histidinol dehydrogenase [Eubacteriaceae bacterium]|nr:histidinol dehydrogenase [Eubacteriaceae bacterium]
MKKLTYQDAVSNLSAVLKRDEADTESVKQTVDAVIAEVKTKGDNALFAFTEKFDGVKLKSLRVTEAEMDEALEKTDPALLAIMREAEANIRAFHEKQLESTWTTSPKPGITLGQKITPLARVGVYVPGGKAAYPSTVLMDTVPALVAGVGSVAMVTPPGKDGSVHPHILAAASVAGVSEIYKVGGAQAVAALAYGTESIAPVDKIVGPGNIFVATAKRAVFGQVAIDMIAGPSEVLLLADERANVTYAAADLLSQAEHDEMAMPILVTTSEAFADAVIAEIDRQLTVDLRRKAIARASVRDFGFAFICGNLDEAFDMAARIAPEHMEIMLPDAETYLDRVVNAGAVFLGSYSPEPLGDYFAGPNHTLPTSGTAKFSSPLGVYDFLKRTSIIQYSRDALSEAADKIAAFAYAEGLDAHAKSIERRFES